MVARGGDLQRADSDYVASASVRIARPASVVWPVLRDFDKWRHLPHAPLHVAGPSGEVGEVLLVSKGRNRLGQTTCAFARTVLVDPPCKLVFRFWTEPAEAEGYLTYSLDEWEGRTRVAYDVVLRVHDENTSSDAKVGQLKRQRDTDERRFNDEFKRLAALLENATNPMAVVSDTCGTPR